MCHEDRIQRRCHPKPVWWADDKRFGFIDTWPIWVTAAVVAGVLALLLLTQG